MRIKQVNLINFRNYTNSSIELSAGLNIFLGENAQGKTNFLEAVELISTGCSSRSTSEKDFIRHGEKTMHIELLFERRNVDESLALTLLNTDAVIPGHSEKLQKRSIKVNGVGYSMFKKLRGRLITVTFNSNDLQLLRSGPSCRRDWLDSVIMRLKPSFYEEVSRYQKIIQQRNRLLKNLAESGRFSDKDNEQLNIWSEEVARYGANIIRWRNKVLRAMLGKVQYYLALISDQTENIALAYRCQSLRSENKTWQQKSACNYYDTGITDVSSVMGNSEIVLKSEEFEMQETKENLVYSLSKRRAEEIARSQTLSGPHRDDIIFLLNGNDAVAFASQGQQRSLVLALKLSELDLIADQLLEPPVLLLDDVLAELDLRRQSLLMSQIDETVQTIVSTTHFAEFDSNLSKAASYYEVRSGTICPINSKVYLNEDRRNFSQSEAMR